MKPPDFIPTMKRRMAVAAIGPSSLRGQGRGVLKASQDFLTAIPLARIPKTSVTRVQAWLDLQTERLLDMLPLRNRPWGAARKALNLFLRDALYNQYLSRRFGLSQIEKWLEVPLDSLVAKGLIEEAGPDALPRWPGLKHLEPATSAQFQAVALRHANARKISRVHLDIYLWLENR